jgi:hypothetical protein
MASSSQVKQYLAFWFQLGKKVVVGNGKMALSPQSVIAGDRYSPEFEACWQAIDREGSAECYLEGTTQTIAQLLSAEWELYPCVRCEMLVPVKQLGLPHATCPCSDLPTWPNLDVPRPRLPVNTQRYLSDIRQRLENFSRSKSKDEPETEDN